jgi:hypothetical protein
MPVSDKTLGPVQQFRVLFQYILRTAGTFSAGKAFVEKAEHHVAPQTGIFKGIGNRLNIFKIRMQVPMIGKTCGSAFYHFQGRELSADTGMFRGHIGDYGNQVTQVPWVEVHIITDTLYQRLVDMGMGVDETRENIPVFTVQNLFRLSVQVSPDSLNPAVCYPDITIADNFVPRVHRQQSAAAY